MSSKKKKYYAYLLPSGKSGVTDDWSSCEKIVSGVMGAHYRGFFSKEDAQAWLREGARYEIKVHKKAGPGIYFDAGTGRGEGVEISVTDENGRNLLHKALPKKELNRFGKHLLDDEATNNYGELLALRYALVIAKKEKAKKIFGDSKLVIEYWSRHRAKRKELPRETVHLLDEVAELREKFEAAGGVVLRISGDDNPADLGFHR
ncbi:MAG: ribonuclease H family protein [Minisyncoccia bacterium]|jgi:ribonuclease HI